MKPHHLPGTLAKPRWRAPHPSPPFNRALCRGRPHLGGSTAGFDRRRSGFIRLTISCRHGIIQPGDGPKKGPAVEHSGLSAPELPARALAGCGISSGTRLDLPGQHGLEKARRLKTPFRRRRRKLSVILVTPSKTCRPPLPPATLKLRVNWSKPCRSKRRSLPLGRKEAKLPSLELPSPIPNARVLRRLTEPAPRQRVAQRVIRAGRPSSRATSWWDLMIVPGHRAHDRTEKVGEFLKAKGDRQGPPRWAFRASDPRGSVPSLLPRHWRKRCLWGASARIPKSRGRIR